MKPFLYLFAGFALLLPNAQAMMVLRDSADKMLRNAGAVAVVKVESVERAAEFDSVCGERFDGYEIGVRIYEKWSVQRPRSIICSRESWCLDCRVLVAVYAEGRRHVLDSWIVERWTDEWIVRPKLADQLLGMPPKLQPQNLRACYGPSDRSCFEGVIFHYYRLDDLRRWYESLVAADAKNRTNP